MALQVGVGPRAQRVQLEKRDLLDHLVQVDLPVPVVIQVIRDRLDQLDQVVQVDQVVLLDQVAQLAQVDRQVLVVPVVQVDQVAQLDQLAQQDQVDLLD